MINQFSPAQEDGKYVVKVDLETYKLLQRLKTINYPSEIHIYLGENGKIDGLRVFKVKYERLTSPSG